MDFVHCSSICFCFAMKKAHSYSRSGRSLQEYLALSGETLELELNSLNLISTGKKDEKPLTLWNNGMGHEQTWMRVHNQHPRPSCQ